MQGWSEGSNKRDVMGLILSDCDRKHVNLDVWQESLARMISIKAPDTNAGGEHLRYYESTMQLWHVGLRMLRWLHTCFHLTLYRSLEIEFVSGDLAFWFPWRWLRLQQMQSFLQISWQICLLKQCQPEAWRVVDIGYRFSYARNPCNKQIQAAVLIVLHMFTWITTTVCETLINLDVHVLVSVAVLGCSSLTGLVTLSPAQGLWMQSWWTAWKT